MNKTMIFIIFSLFCFGCITNSNNENIFDNNKIYDEIKQFITLYELGHMLLINTSDLGNSATSIVVSLYSQKCSIDNRGSQMGYNDINKDISNYSQLYRIITIPSILVKIPKKKIMNNAGGLKEYNYEATINQKLNNEVMTNYTQHVSYQLISSDNTNDVKVQLVIVFFAKSTTNNPAKYISCLEKRELHISNEEGKWKILTEKREVEVQDHASGASRAAGELGSAPNGAKLSRVCGRVSSEFFCRDGAVRGKSGVVW